jgi:hypothetical protein
VTLSVAAARLAPAANIQPSPAPPYLPPKPGNRAFLLLALSAVIRLIGTALGSGRLAVKMTGTGRSGQATATSNTPLPT